MLIRDGGQVYRGRPIAPFAAAARLADAALRGLRRWRRAPKRPEAQSQPASSRSRIATIISMWAGSAFRHGM